MSRVYGQFSQPEIFAGSRGEHVRSQAPRLRRVMDRLSGAICIAISRTSRYRRRGDATRANRAALISSRPARSRLLASCDLGRVLPELLSRSCNSFRSEIKTTAARETHAKAFSPSPTGERSREEKVTAPGGIYAGSFGIRKLLLRGEITAPTAAT